MCKHINVHITEEGIAYTEHDREDGKWSHYTTMGGYVGKIYVDCFDCGLSKTYTFKNKPKWLVKYMNEFIFSE